MEQSVNDFVSYLEENKRLSDNTRQSYRRDLIKMKNFMTSLGISAPENITVTNVNAYILKLEKDGMSAATISRSIVSMKAYFKYLMQKKRIDYEPVDFLKAPPIEKKRPTILTIDEVDRLLNQLSINSPKEIRDKAMIELLYATGIRVSEIILLKEKDVNMEMEYIICSNKNKDRIIPFGNAAKKALQLYIYGAREELVNGEEELLFVNCKGKPMSRQGFWKIIKSYGVKAGIDTDITPHIIRHSFAAHLVANGADLKSVQEMMGLSDISSTKVYADMKKQRIRTVYDNTHPRK